jgi:chromosome segregation ATPase
MQLATALLLVSTATYVRASALSAGSKGAAIDKVIEMLAKEKTKIAGDLEEENKAMTEYFGYCDDVQKELNYYIKEATRKIEDNSALIEDRSAQIQAAEEELAELGTEEAERSEEMEKADKLRRKEHEEFLTRENEQKIMVDELNQMEIALKEQMAAMTTPPPVAEPEEGAFVQQGVSGGAASSAQEDASDEEEELETPTEGYETLLQVQHQHKRRQASKFQAMPRLTANMLRNVDLNAFRETMSRVVGELGQDPETQSQVRTIGNFLQSAEDPPPVEVSAEAMAGQQKNTEDNMAAFEGLKGKAEKALQAERDNEAKKQSEHTANMMSLKQAQMICEDNIQDAKKDKARLSQEKGEAEGELASATTSKEADSKKLKDLVAECNSAADAWEHRQKEAAAEMAAIEKAKEILQSRVKVFLQISRTTHRISGASLTQTKTEKVQQLRQTLINHFRAMGQKIGSLSMLNLVSVASVQPLDKVKGLIKDMIAKLEKEAAEAAAQHEFCEAEKAKNKAATEKATKKKEELEATLDKSAARKDELTDMIATLTEEIAEIDKSGAEMENIRQEDHTLFVKQEADFSEAAAAVQDAIDVLKDYYDNAGFLQISSTTHSKAPPKLGGAKQDSAGGILGILDTMAGEFTKTVAELQATEEEQVKAYKETKKNNFDTKTAKETEIIKAENDIGSLEITIGHAEEDKKLTENELKAIAEYVEKLKPTCEGRVMSYEERKAKRDAEIAGLKEALTALEENTPTFLQIRSTVNRH